MNWKDEIVEEVRAVREAYAAQFDYDLDRMFADLQEKERQSSAPFADLQPVQPVPADVPEGLDRGSPT